MAKKGINFTIKYGNVVLDGNFDQRGMVEAVMDIIYGTKYNDKIDHQIDDKIRENFYNKINERHSGWIANPDKYNLTDEKTRKIKYFDNPFSFGNPPTKFYLSNHWYYHANKTGTLADFLKILQDFFANETAKFEIKPIEGKDEEKESENTSDPEEASKRKKEENNLKLQIIYFGAPGTGKSYKLNEEAKKHFTDKTIENDVEKIDKRYERVTFYPGYSYQQFVGTYKPYMNGKEIAYKFVPGPLMRVLVKAIKNPDKKYLLIVEELNRAEAAAVFGDFFQLLDRNSNGESEYPIVTSEDVRKYLIDEKKINNEIAEELKFPNNFYVWTTMNSADQGVFPLDTAFKRRWEFEYVGINEGKDKITNDEWKKLRNNINEKMLENGINEDKLMGPFFLKESEQKEENFVDSFCSKVLLYLFEDAMRFKRKQIFAVDYWKSYSKLCEAFREIKDAVFVFSELDKGKQNQKDGSSDQIETVEKSDSENQ